MGRQIMHILCTVVFVMISWVNVAQAVSLGKVDVASHLGEVFYAEVGLGLDKGEVISSVFVELASPADYRILEVFRDKSLNAIRADVKSDSRGSRVELTSSSVIESPFFNLVIKVRHGRATHFKKYAVFLDLPRSAKAPVNTPVPSEQQQAPVEAVTEVVKIAAESAFKAYDGWARTGQYGPMVFGDTITTVAQRLRVDERYSNKQVMVALFEKNKAKFDQSNINLIKAGTFLDVPTADEVEQVSRQRARDVLKEHNRKWRELTKQSKYAQVKSAQENRYSKRVHMGEQASGVAAAPLADSASPEVSLQPEVLAVKGRSAPQANEKPSVMTALKTENDSLQQRLLDMEAKLSKLIEQPNASEVLAASESRIKKLELQLARQSSELEKARLQAGSDGSLNLLTWLLMGVIALLTLIAVYLAFALRGQRQMPGELKEEAVDEQPEMLEEVDPVEPADAQSQSPVESDTVDILDDAIPDLTDEETSEMEAFQEPDEEADPNVDYLSEADVYMRYGMEDEAEKQVKMALRMREDNKDAHVKLVQMRHARGDQAGVEEAADVARGVLQGSALTAFVEAYDLLSGSAEAAGNLDDTMPPTVFENAVEESGNGDELVVDDFDLPDFATDATEQPAQDNLAESEDSLDHLNLSDIEWSDESQTDELDEAEELEVADLKDESSALIDDLELPSDSEESAGHSENDVLADFEEDSPLDLSDLDIPVAEAAAEPDASVASSIEEQELDNTVVMDWSKDTSIIKNGEEAGSESGANPAFVAEPENNTADLVSDETQASSAGLDIDVSGLASLDDELKELGTEVVADLNEEPDGDALSSINLSLDDLDIDMSAVEHDAEIEEFTSTIQATLTELGVDNSEIEMLPSSTGEGKSVDAVDAETQFGDFDASLELESLLSDLEELESDDDKKAK